MSSNETSDEDIADPSEVQINAVPQVPEEDASDGPSDHVDLFRGSSRGIDSSPSTSHSSLGLESDSSADESDLPAASSSQNHHGALHGPTQPKRRRNRARSNTEDVDAIWKSPPTQGSVFDTNVVDRHTYMGENLTSSSVAPEWSLRCGATLRIPVIALAGVVLIPGHTIPLSSYEPRVRHSLKWAISRASHIGIITREALSLFSCASLSRTSDFSVFGTLAEVRQYKEEDGPDLNDPSQRRPQLSCIAQGRQRFRLEGLIRVQSDDNPHIHFGDVTIIEDTGDDIGPFVPLIPTLSRSHHAGLFSQPRWLHQQAFSVDFLCKRIMKLLDFIGFCGTSSEYGSGDSVIGTFEKATSGKYPTDPTQLSWWLTANLPQSDSRKHALLGVCSLVERLRLLTLFLQRCSTAGHLSCSFCGINISSTRDIVPMTPRGPMGTFVNSLGYVHQMFTVRKVLTDSAIKFRGKSTEENSWFPGYAWTIMECRGCQTHLGWAFDAVKKDLWPPRFYGLCRTSVQVQFQMFAPQCCAKNSPYTIEGPDIILASDPTAPIDTEEGEVSANDLATANADVPELTDSLVDAMIRRPSFRQRALNSAIMRRIFGRLSTVVRRRASTSPSSASTSDSSDGWRTAEEQ